MKLYQLRYFFVLATELHFGRAAARLSITQPPLSGAIKALEEELGTTLFLRTNRHVSLTPAGAALREEARHILQRINHAAEVTRAVAEGRRGRLDVGFVGSLIYREVPAIVHRFADSYPDVEVVLHESSTTQQLEELLHDELDVGFLNASTTPPELSSLPLADDQYYCCLPVNHRMATHQTVRVRDLVQDHFVMFSRDAAPAHYDNLVAMLNSAGVRPKLVHAALQWLTVIALVAQGFGVALVPRSLAQTQMHGIVFVPLAHLTTPTRALMVWREQPWNAALTAFLEAAAHVLGTPLPTARKAPTAFHRR